MQSLILIKKKKICTCFQNVRPNSTNIHMEIADSICDGLFWNRALANSHAAFTFPQYMKLINSLMISKRKNFALLRGKIVSKVKDVYKRCVRNTFVLNTYYFLSAKLRDVRSRREGCGKFSVVFTHSKRVQKLRTQRWTLHTLNGRHVDDVAEVA